LDVLVGEHLAFFDALGAVARDQQMLLDRFAPFDRATGLGLQDAEDAVGVAHRGDFGVGDDDGFVGKEQRHEGAALDPGGRIAHDVVEAHRFELAHHLFHAFFGEGFLVLGLGGGQDVQGVDVLVFDERLGELGLALEDVDEIVDDAAFAAHDEVEVAQADVEVDDGGLEAAKRQARGESGAGGGLAHPSFAGSDDDDAHVVSLSNGFDGFDEQVALPLNDLQFYLHGAVCDRGGKTVFERLVHPGDGNELGAEVGGDDAGFQVAAGSGEHPSAPGAQQVDAAGGDDLGGRGWNRP